MHKISRLAPCARLCGVARLAWAFNGAQRCKWMKEHVGISLVNCFRSSKSAPQDKSSLGSHVDGDTSSEQEPRKRGGRDSEDAGVYAVSSDDVDITEEDCDGAAIVGEKSPPEFPIVGTSAPGRELTGQASILSFARQLTRRAAGRCRRTAAFKCGYTEYTAPLLRPPVYTVYTVYTEYTGYTGAAIPMYI
eukprot:353915-Chlamydomonas_euryale.AAC.3